MSSQPTTANSDGDGAAALRRADPLVQDGVVAVDAGASTRRSSAPRPKASSAISALLTLVKGFPGTPSHAPLTDVSVAHAVAVAALVAGALGFEEEATATAALLAISVGLIVAVPSSLTGLLDWADTSRRSCRWPTR
jgi:hypothetical protein